MTTLDRIHMLRAETPPEEVKHRPLRKDGPAVLPYVDARYVMDVLDQVVGPGDWQDRFEEVPGGVRCGIGILIGEEWIWKYDVGVPSDMEATKGAYSDALKRAAVKWGIARDLYEDGPKRPQNGHTAAPTRPAAPVAVRAAVPARSSTAVPEPPLDWDVLDNKKPQPFAQAQAAKIDPDGSWTYPQLADKAKALSVPLKVLGDTSKRLFGPDAWKLTDLTGEQRYMVAVEVGLL
jgi:hypothetical protein